MAQKKVIPEIKDLNLWAGARESLFAVFSYKNSRRDLSSNPNWIEFLQWVHSSENDHSTSARRRAESYLPSSDEALNELSRGLGKLFQFHAERPIPREQQRTFVIEMLACLPSFKGVKWSDETINHLLPMWSGEDIRHVTPRSCLEAAQLKIQSIPEELNRCLPPGVQRFTTRSPSSFARSDNKLIGYSGTFAPDEYDLDFIQFIIEGLWKIPAPLSQNLAMIIKKLADQSEMGQQRQRLKALLEALEGNREILD